MNFLGVLLFSILGSVISGAFGMVAWNMCIPVIFVGAPKITIIQSIIVAMVLSIMTYGGTSPEDKTDTENFAATAIIRILIILIVSSISLGVLWLVMQIAY